MALAPIVGRAAYIFAEDNFDVDQIVGPENISERDIERLAIVAMQNYDPEFAALVRPGDIIIGGANFGYGHPHYPPMIALRHLGIVAVIAESFAPGYWREEMEEGFPQIACPGILDLVDRWDTVEVDYAAGTVRNPARDRTLPIEPFTPSEMQILEVGGLDNFLKISPLVG